MKSDRPNPSLPVQSPPNVMPRELEALLAAPFADAWATEPGAPTAARLRDRLAQRTASTRRAERDMVTVRVRSAPRVELADGVTCRVLYEAPDPTALRPGEPNRVVCIELPAGAAYCPPAGPAALHREWLVLSGAVRRDGEPLSQRDYHVTPAGGAAGTWQSEAGASLFLRESAIPAATGDVSFTVHDAAAGWVDLTSRIRRRVLWQRDGQAAMLYFALPGAKVPLHIHQHDEECIVLQGEVFLDDVLLRPGDYQLAPAGGGHRVTETETGVVVYAHGDLDIHFPA